uniref:N-acetylated-alpha-linked acidic dipeptidase-like protein n=1 Tax=Sphaerodactylus townsendi TaxID=933632 RepID=A0ACB8G9V6_9SAUR
MATTDGDKELVQLLLTRWRNPETGLDLATEVVYDVFLSFPDSERPNSVVVVLENGTQPFISQQKEKNLTADQNDPAVVRPYAAYAPPGNPQGKLVYANQGKLSDYEELVQNGIELNGTIAITRYGGAGRSAKAINGAKFGVIGVVVYTDPADINDGIVSEEQTYPNSWYMPPSGVERGSYSDHFGDLLTPYYAAKDFTYRIPEDNITGIPLIPTQPIGFEDAKILICNVQVNVYNHRRIEKSSNVLGLIRGSVEPDRYVLYGNHRDSWVHGAIDPSSGTAAMLEITRVLGKMLKEGKWRPRRSIIFGSWGAEEFGLIGSTEYTEEFFSKLQQRSVAYINVDIAVFANATLSVSGTPPAQSVVFKATKQVRTPDNSNSVYENWKLYFNRNSSIYGVIPRLGSLGAGSDYAPFIHYLGITSMDISYTYDRSKTSARIYPAYHTAFDTFDYADRFIDPGFTSHQTVARTAGNILMRLADTLILPLNVTDYGEMLEQMYKAADHEDIVADLRNHNISLAPLQAAIAQFKSAAAGLDQRIASLQEEESPSPLHVRMVNDQLMLLERAFLNPRAFPDEYYYSHIIMASRSSSIATFPGLANAYSSAKVSGNWEKVRQHLTIVIQAIENAASILEPVAQ